MKRLHLHVSVEDVTAAARFYSTLFAAEPTVLKDDYAKWMLDDPRVNFAISSRGDKPGLDHLGIQVDDASELSELKARAQSADMTLLDEGATTCCYAKSEKHWVTDPQGIAWEHFHTLGNIPVFNETTKVPVGDASCAPSAVAAEPACCGPASATVATSTAATKSSCC